MRYLLIFLISFSSFAYVDLSIQYSASKRESISDPNIEGDLMTETKTISATWAWYIWEYTALEFNYSKSEETQLNTRRQQIEPTFVLTKTETLTETEVKGIGLRLSFAKRRAFIVPTLSGGYALYTTQGRTDYDYEISGTSGSSSYEVDEETSSSSYITAGLKFNFSKYMGISLTAKSVMEDFDFAQADKNITYLAGLSWVF